MGGGAFFARRAVVFSVKAIYHPQPTPIPNLRVVTLLPRARINQAETTS
ncbi:hypothetical protein THTE_4471 [Thermogutta terrifontis]|uniref:Uncharacterized protein n=1 Tax=Thermogutta terrifontis TaxID=1331910 RepID=A0A286RM86_9BACT|nr:hypothetical protein THTE_4471 [Thermogutta terrifontis]